MSLPADAIRSAGGAPQGWGLLKARLLARYDEFVARLTSRLGSADLAREVLHDTYLQMERAVEAPAVRNPDGYIFRAALNIAHNRRVRDARYRGQGAEDLLASLSDDTPDPARAAEAASEVDRVRRALAELPQRRREIFVASWVDETPHAELAIRYGVHLRTIQRELNEATAFVRAQCLACDSTSRRGTSLQLSSRHMSHDPDASAPRRGSPRGERGS